MPTSHQARLLYPVLIAAAILFSQLLFRPIVGLADNNDFVNITGPLKLVPAGGETAPDRFFRYIVPVWKQDPSEPVKVRLLTSSILPVAAVLYATKPLSGGLLGLRMAGLVHSLIFLVALRLIAPVIRSPVVWVAILAVLCDVTYFSWFNSMYMDTGSFLYLMLAVAFYGRLAGDYGSRRWNGIGLLAAIFLLITSKLQHTFLLAPVVPLLLLDPRIRGAVSLKRIAAYCAALVLAAVGMYQVVPYDYRASAAYHIVFSDLLVNSAQPEAVLQELDLPRSMAYLKGTDSYEAGSGMRHPIYRGILLERLSHAKLLGYYLRHPQAPLRLILTALGREAFERQYGYGNFAKEAGKPPFTRSGAFSIVSELRREAFFNRPIAVLLYLCTIGVALLFYTRFAAAAWALLAMAAIEFLISALADCKETMRHLFLFRALMDVALLALIHRLCHVYGIFVEHRHA